MPIFLHQKLCISKLSFIYALSLNHDCLYTVSTSLSCTCCTYTWKSPHVVHILIYLETCPVIKGRGWTYYFCGSWNHHQSPLRASIFYLLHSFSHNGFVLLKALCLGKAETVTFEISVEIGECFLLTAWLSAFSFFQVCWGYDFV